MKNKFKFFKIPGISFLAGIIFVLVGLKGEQLAVIYSKPLNSTSWTTSGSLINAFIYIPIIIGTILLILSIGTFLLSYNKLQKNAL
ncbi:hypothetical protein [Ureibacillus chungkukjangi]|uniref:Uncharacterized protein n=1 Tax=Ureibacillus chungkukjangi TaxID=1202712 RepID=A0A318TDP5_9BACL|nr:hypothetical protein [Ureibacillus chungkukjangi]PYF01960.1 hypothetical protein BJ095_1512 [Ureibacillus chungkukjangi]